MKFLVVALVGALPCREISTACHQQVPPLNFAAYCQTPGGSPWQSRQAVAASWIWETQPRFVLDLGAGCLELQKLLPASVSANYIADEIMKGGCDYNHAVPNIPDDERKPGGVVVVLGVVEYLCDPSSFLKALKMYNQGVIISYAIAPEPMAALLPRLNAFTSQQWEEVLAESGWTAAQRNAKVFTGFQSNVLHYFPPPQWSPTADKQTIRNTTTHEAKRE